MHTQAPQVIIKLRFSADSALGLCTRINHLFATAMWLVCVALYLHDIGAFFSQCFHDLIARTRRVGCARGVLSPS